MFFCTDTNKHIYIKNIMLLIFFVKLEIVMQKSFSSLIVNYIRFGHICQNNHNRIFFSNIKQPL